LNIDFTLLAAHRDGNQPGNARVAAIRQAAQSLITIVILREQLAVARVIPLATGMWSAVFLLDPLNIVLKFPNDIYETDFFQLADTHYIPTPRYIHDGYITAHELENVYYVLMEYVPETENPETLFYAEQLTREQLLQLAHDVSQALCQMHRVKMGYLGNKHQTFQNWGDLLQSRFQIDAERLVPSKLFDQELLTRLHEILHKSSYRAYTDGRMMHGDLHLGNTLVDTQTRQLRAIIDPWNYIAGMPMYDLAYASLPWEYGMAYHQRVLAHYRANTDTFNHQLYNISLLIIAYWENQQTTDTSEIQKIRSMLFDYVLPQINI
jgi:aminoglycoside phosphotransferase (APT) family kinase protein